MATASSSSSTERPQYLSELQTCPSSSSLDPNAPNDIPLPARLPELQILNVAVGFGDGGDGLVPLAEERRGCQPPAYDDIITSAVSRSRSRSRSRLSENINIDAMRGSASDTYQMSVIQPPRERSVWPPRERSVSPPRERSVSPPPPY